MPRGMYDMSTDKCGVVDKHHKENAKKTAAAECAAEQLLEQKELARKEKKRLHARIRADNMSAPMKKGLEARINELNGFIHYDQEISGYGSSTSETSRADSAVGKDKRIKSESQSSG